MKVLIVSACIKGEKGKETYKFLLRRTN
jgi:hypothetical protein